jgi:hypothetical protein
MTKKTLLPLLILLINSFSYAKTGDYYPEYDCTWKLDGCMRGNEYIIDLRNQAQIEIDKLRQNHIKNGGDPYTFLTNSPDIYSSQKISEIIQKAEYDHGITEKKYFIPIGLTKPERIAALATASLGLIVFANDQEIMDFVQDNKTEMTHKIEDFGYYAGSDGIVQLAAGSYFLGAIFKNGKLKDVGLLTVATGIVSQSITEAFKLGFGRTRPRNADGNPYLFGADGKSFFSGHASGAFGTAAVLAEVYKGTPVPYVAYGVAGLVAYARVHGKGHYTSDVVFGALAGVLSAKLTMRFLNGDDSQGGLVLTPGFYEDPMTKENYYMMNFSWSARRPRDKITCDEFNDLHQREKIRKCIKKVFDLSYEN